MHAYWLEQNEADLPSNDDWLSPREATLLGSMRFAKRRADWRLGRWTAKLAAAAYLGLYAGPHTLQKIEVCPAPSGAPELFLKGRPAPVGISISHRAGIAICAIATYVALGCDVELIELRDESFVTDYFTGAEQEQIRRAPSQDRLRLVTVLWSAKESALKALRHGLRLDTRNVAVTLLSPVDSGVSCWYPLLVRSAAGEVLHGWWQSTERLVRTLAAHPAPAAPLPLQAALGCNGATARAAARPRYASMTAGSLRICSG